MKPIYKSLALAAMTLQVSVALNAQTYDGTTTSDTELPAELLDSLRVELVAPNVSGARDLIKSGECTVSDNVLSVELPTGDWLKGGVYRLQVSATFGTQTEVIYVLDITVPRYNALADETQEYEDTVTVVSTVGGGTGGGGADATVYALDGDGNANITKPLNVNGSVQEGSPYGTDIYELDVVVLTQEQKEEVEEGTGTAYDYCDINGNFGEVANVTIYADEECTQKVGSTVKIEYASIGEEGEELGGYFFNLQVGESITDGVYYARGERGTSGINSHAEGIASTASGNNSHAEGSNSTASGDNSHAEGLGTTSSGMCSHAEGQYTIGSGNNSHAEGNGSRATGDHSHAEGSGTFASRNNSHAEGSGSNATGNNSHAEGINSTASGDNSHAEGHSTASGDNSHAEGKGSRATGINSHAEGEGTIASKANQHVCGQYNVQDADDSFQFIVGNGTGTANRRNAFAITKSGELALFEADGTPVILDAATLKALIASV